MSSRFTGKIKPILLRIARNRSMFRYIGIGLFVLILTRIDLRQAWQTLLTVDLRFIGLTLVIQFVALFVASVRWWLILQRLEIRLPLRKTFLHQLIGTGAALATPGQLGEFVKVLYHRQEGFPVAESVLSVVMDRLCDLLLLLVFGFISLALLFGLPPLWTFLLTAAGVAAGLAAFIFLRDKEKSAEWIAGLLKRLSPKAYKDAIHQDAHRLVRRIGDLDGRFLALIGLLTVGNYILLMVRVYCGLAALHLQVPLPYFVQVVPLLRLVGLIPISISGIGTRDVTSIYMWGRVGVPAASALISSSIGLLTLQLQTLVGLLVMWRYPLESKKEGKDKQENQEPEAEDASSASESSLAD